MQIFRFYKVCPGGNSTIFILNHVPEKAHAPLALRLLADDHLQAEQVGYLEHTGEYPRLAMMGGEFCGNACRGAAAVLYAEGLLTQKDGFWTTTLQVSGLQEPLEVRAQAKADGLHCSSEMPLPTRPVLTEREPGIALVQLPGITHILIDEQVHPFPADFALKTQALRARLTPENPEAVGCIWYRHARDQVAIRPVVWVRSTQSLYFETACGSGSLALGLWLGHNTPRPFSLRVEQPSKQHISVLLHADKAWISGPVSLVARGETWL